MNIVKGVADLIRRTSTDHSSVSGSGSPLERFSLPTPRIHFSDVGDEAILNTLWGRYENAFDKVEKRKLFHIFLKQFLIIYNNWEPESPSQFAEAASSATSPVEYTHVHDIVVGCSTGHPDEIILTLSEEVTQITTLVTELNTSMLQSTTDQVGISTSMIITSEGLPVLDALTVVTRSMHNCRVFGYYGGIQKLTALMKAAVVKLKTITGTFSADENLSHFILEKTGILQKLLVYVVSIVCGFIATYSDVYQKAQLYNSSLEFSVPRGGPTSIDPSSILNNPLSQTRLHWHQKAVVLVMEAGGLNWLVELLRVMRRLSMKEQWTDISLQHLTLRALLSALADNPRGQNHFRSIGGLEVLLDGLGLPSINALGSRNSICSDKERDGSPLLVIFLLHVLSLEVLREAVFGNLNNLQFLCENGRVHKFANSFCSLAFMLQEYRQQTNALSVQEDFQMLLSDSNNKDNSNIHDPEPSAQLSASSYIQHWNDYVVKLSRVLVSFLLAPEDIKSYHVQLSAGRSAIPVSSMYGELSIKWFMRALLTVFPCIKACSNQNELPRHLRIFVYTLQHYVLFAFRKVLVSSPALLDVFRAEGVWDLIFSENFFYFGPTSAECFGEYCFYNEAPPWNFDIYSSSNSIKNQANANEVDILQVEVISFVEFAATLNESSHNLPECSVLLDALEQSACNPDIGGVLAKSLLRTLQLSAEKTVSSFKTLFLSFFLSVFSSNYYQALFLDGQCFLHVISLLNGTLNEEDGEKLVLNVLQTLKCLLANNDVSKLQEPAGRLPLLSRKRDSAFLARKRDGNAFPKRKNRAPKEDGSLPFVFVAVVFLAVAVPSSSPAVNQIVAVAKEKEEEGGGGGGGGGGCGRRRRRRRRPEEEENEEGGRQRLRPKTDEEEEEEEEEAAARRLT